eukprot:gene7059-9513_t
MSDNRAITPEQLATPQALISQLEERTKAPNDRKPSILAAPTMFQVANIVGATLRDTISARALTGPSAASPAPNFNASVILGGQIKGTEQRQGGNKDAGEEQADERGGAGRILHGEILLLGMHRRRRGSTKPRIGPSVAPDQPACIRDHSCFPARTSVPFVASNA